MATRVSAYHSVDQDVYHVYRECVVGNNIERDKLRYGTGGRRLCKRCKDIEAGLVTR